MKFQCPCGAWIQDITDYLPYKGHLICDGDWFDLHEAIDAAIENPHFSEKEKEAACMKIRDVFSLITREVYQCTKCGCLHIEDTKHKYHVFKPPMDVPKNILCSERRLKD